MLNPPLCRHCAGLQRAQGVMCRLVCWLLILQQCHGGLVVQACEMLMSYSPSPLSYLCCWTFPGHAAGSYVQSGASSVLQPSVNLHCSRPCRCLPLLTMLSHATTAINDHTHANHADPRQWPSRAAAKRSHTCCLLLRGWLMLAMMPPLSQKALCCWCWRPRASWPCRLGHRAGR